MGNLALLHAGGAGGSPLLQNLIAHWKLEEVSGSRADAHGSNTLTDNNTTFGVATKGGKAAQFTAANSESLSIASNAALSTGDIDFSIAAWVYLDSKTANMMFVAKGPQDATPGRPEYSLEYLQSTDRFRLAAYDTVTSAAAAATTLGSPSTATWYFIVGWHDATANTLNIQVNNGTADSSAYTMGTPNSGNAFHVGADSDPANFMNGRISNVGFWKKALTADERTALYASGNGKAYADLTTDEKVSLVSYWNLDEESGTRNDSHGTNHLTDNNTVTQKSGKLTNAAQFVAANSEYLSIADNAALSVADVDFTLAGWVYLESITPTQYFLTKGSAAAAATIEYGLLYDTGDDRFKFFVGNGTIFTTATANNLGAPSAGTWYFIVAWHDAAANTVNIQVNDGTVDSAAHTVGCQNGAAALNIGQNSAGGDFLGGRVDSLSFWKRVLTSQERTDLYNTGAGKEYPFNT